MAIRLYAALTLILIVALLAPTAHAQSTTLGRFFSTPEQRTALDEARTELLTQMALDELARLESQTASTQEAVANVTLHMGGSLRHADGSHTVWLNGTAFDERDLPVGYSLVQSGPVTSLRIQGNDAVYFLRPGQILDRAERVVREQEFAATIAARGPQPEAAAESAPSSPSSNRGNPDDDENTSRRPSELDDMLPGAQRVLSIIEVLSVLQENL